MTTTTAPQERGTCPVCRRLITLAQDETIAPHGLAGNCPGTSKPPAGMVQRPLKVELSEDELAMLVQYASGRLYEGRETAYFTPELADAKAEVLRWLAAR